MSDQFVGAVPSAEAPNTEDVWRPSDPTKQRRLDRLRGVVRDALENDMSTTAAWYADKLVTLSQGNAEDVLLLARSFHASGDYARAARVLRTRKAYGAPGQPIAQCVCLLTYLPGLVFATGSAVDTRVPLHQSN